MILRGRFFSIHRECLASAPLPDSHRAMLVEALQALQETHPRGRYSVIDYDLQGGRCRFLAFDCDQPFPEATHSFEYSRESRRVRRIRFRRGSGPVLIDQALILPRWHPYFEAAHRQLRDEESSGLDVLGQKERPAGSEWVAPKPEQWERHKGAPAGHRLCTLDCQGCYLALGKGKKSARHKTAICRTELSRPVKNVIRDGLLGSRHSFLDYGCGQGEDCELLDKEGVSVQGWDPVFRPMPEPQPADVVNLGYIINVIENPQERIATLTRAFSLARKLLVVAAYMANGIATKHAHAVPFGDGVLTSRGTFQKLYRQKELRLFIESTLGQKADSADFGVYYVFKDPELRREFIASRASPAAATRSTPRKKRATGGQLSEEIAAPVIRAAERLGRLPLEEECAELAVARRQAGGAQALTDLVLKRADPALIERASEFRRQELLIELAASRLSEHGRPLLRELPKSHQADLRAFFPSYKEACSAADQLLQRLGNSESIDRACQDFGLGKMLPDALYVHVSLVAILPPLLRLLVQCAGNYAAGELPESVSVLKIKRDGHGVTFIESEDFFNVAHPAVMRTTKVKFLQHKVISRDFTESRNPTIYHRKELFLAPEHEHFERFAALTRQEEEAGLLGLPTIGRRIQWENLLAERGMKVVGHRLLNIEELHPDGHAAPQSTDSLHHRI